MILVTVGTQLPFDRLIKAVDQWAALNLQHEVYGPLGETKYIPQHISGSSFLEASAFDAKVAEADLIIAHAGMGSIITAIETMKPIVVMPRLAKHGEHRNDHQMATVNKLAKLSNVHIAENETALPYVIEGALKQQGLVANSDSENRVALLSSVKSFLGSSAENQPITNQRLRA